jgi:membrane-bound ClpP family serine protease
MPLWLILVIVGAVLLILGVAIEAAKVLIWIGVAILVVSLVIALLNRAKGASKKV